MIELTDLATERTTAVTNLLISLVGLVALVYFHTFRALEPWKVKIWTAAAVCLMAANTAAAAVHGLKLAEPMHKAIWALTELSLGLLIACFVVGTVRDLWSERASRVITPVMIVVALLFFAITRFNHNFVIDVLYEGSFVGFAFLGYGYGYLASTRRLPGTGLVCAGLFVTLLAAVVQTTGVEVTLIWTFDHNGVFHLMQLLGVILLAVGIGASLRAEMPRRATR